ncbi:hypothetical protein BY458DRAFT_500670 [Sporodiniella umbellata]|nr:hypothetical protein BY458DRAFT_500670 [Sporodiniella umbellata]
MRVASLTAIVTSLFTGLTLARSPVYVLSEDVNTIPETVSFDAFSMFYSHMMDASQNSVVVQGDHWLPQSRNLFEKKVDANLVVLVSSVQSPQDLLASQKPSFYVSDNDYMGDYSALAEKVASDITENDQDATATIFKLPSICHKEKNTEDLCINTTLSPARFFRDFSDFETDLFDETKEADEQFMHEIESVKEHWSEPKIAPHSLIEIHSLKKLAETYGAESSQYKEASRIVSHLLEAIVIPNFQRAYAHKSLAILALTPIQNQSMKKREESGLCYKTVKECNNATSYCQDHGKCVEHNGCFTCQCNPSYVGESCTYVDAVGEFQLLFWTSVLLIVITTSVVACIYQSGNNMDTGIIMTQSPPKQE